MSWLKTPQRVFFVRSGEQKICPVCNGSLKVIGSRDRFYINGMGEKVTLRIRILRCKSCFKVHRELPDLLVPYKRYGSECIEAVLNGSKTLTVAADDSTINRWKRWFLDISLHFLGCLISIATQHMKRSVEELSSLPGSSLHRIWQHVGDAPRWLARIVRVVANTNNWVHTRSAFLSG